MRIEPQTNETLSKERYIQLHMDAFGKHEEHNPSDIYLGYDGERLIGFATVRATTPTTLYIQFIGFTKDVIENDSKEQKVGYLMNAFIILKSMGFKYITGFIENTNAKAIIWAMKAGFKITGLRSRGASPALLEIILEV
jgi:hypothetical protein